MTGNDDDIRRGDLLVDEAELRALFAPHRPDVAKFAAGVAERLAEPEADVDDSDDDSASATGAGKRPGFGMRTLLDRAASVLPGLPDGSTLGKSWLTAASLPLLLLIGVIVTFVRGFHRVDPTRHRDAPALTARQRTTSRLFPAWLPTFGSLLALALMAIYFLFGSGAVGDAVTPTLMLAMLTLTWHIGQVAREGIHAIQIARATTLLLLAALFGCSLWLSNYVFDGDSLLGHRAVGWTLAIGVALACLLTAVHTRMDPALGLILLFILPISLTTLQLPTDTAARVRQNLEQLHLAPENLGNWQEAANLGHALEVAGLASVDRPRVRERLRQVVEAGVALPPHPWSPEVHEQLRDDASKVHPVVWTSAARLGLLDAAQLGRLATFGFTPSRVADLLEQTSPLRLSSHDEHLLDCLLATRELTAAEREHLAQRLAASWPESGQKVDALQQALACARWLDRLGRRDLIEAHRDDLHDLLRHHWVAKADAVAFSYPGGFCTYPDSRMHADIRSTATAIELIEFVGSPPELSLFHVNAFLRHSIHTSLIGRTVGGRAVLPMQADASILLLHTGVGLPERSWLQALVGERAVLAALLLVILALRAILLAFRAERRLRGALP